MVNDELNRLGTGPVAREVSRAEMVARKQQLNFSETQNNLRQLFGGGGGTFWNLDDSTTKVTINHDLNPSKLNPNDATSSLFGFGGQSERSGLF